MKFSNVFGWSRSSARVASWTPLATIERIVFVGPAADCWIFALSFLIPCGGSHEPPENAVLVSLNKRSACWYIFSMLSGSSGGGEILSRKKKVL